ncbi:DUF5906 domain-containing protein [Neobacillus pocheonensis]|uniref:DUF5906 domain-containing protein n=1 Tax=Neobacillus pocheonensis TaxID=363869 RepID=A0ABT0WAD7_9BACI|nr:DUF5906 domain-containing protein [Neobacillus pocheonensis]
MKFINEHILADSFDQDDFERIIRDEEIKAEDGNEYEVVLQLIRLLNIKEYNEKIYFFDSESNRYKTGERNFEKAVADHLRGQKSYYHTEVLKQISKYVTRVDQPEKGFDIRFKNGIIRHGLGFIEIESLEFTPFYIDLEFNPEAPRVKEIDDYINQLTEGDKNYKLQLAEMIAHALITNEEFKRSLAKFTIIIGKGGEGKGTLIEIISRILGKENCSFNSIKNLADERYAYDLVGKLANLGDDIEDAPITNAEMKMLKNISTCDPVMVRSLHNMAYSTKLTASLIFTSNHLLKTHEKGDSYKRRVTWCPMFNRPSKPDHKLISKLTTPEALQYWLRLVVEGYERLYENKTFTKSKKVESYTEQYHEENNSCEFWVKSIDTNLLIGKRPPEVYNEYEIWALENEGKAQSARAVKNAIESIHGLTVGPRKINGTSAKVYVKADDKRSTCGFKQV